MATDGRYELLPKKEVIKLERERKHLQANLAGIKSLKRLPDALFVIDSNKEQIAVKEARKLGVPTVALIDTDSDPDLIDLPIPGNDDAMRAIELIVHELAEAVIEGKQTRPEKGEEPAGAAGPRAPRRSTRSQFRAVTGDESRAPGAPGAGGEEPASTDAPVEQVPQQQEPVGAAPSA